MCLLNLFRTDMTLKKLAPVLGQRDLVNENQAFCRMYRYSYNKRGWCISTINFFF